MRQLNRSDVLQPPGGLWLRPSEYREMLLLTRTRVYGRELAPRHSRVVVATREAKVSVHGTVFSVFRGAEEDAPTTVRQFPPAR